MKYRIIFIADEVLPHSGPLVELLAKDFRVFRSSISDEFQQVYHQSGKFLVLFSDPKKAILFRSKFLRELQGLDYEVLVYLHTDAKFKAESQKIIDENRLRVFGLSDVPGLREYARNYFEQDLSPELDLEFNSDTKLSTEE